VTAEINKNIATLEQHISSMQFHVALRRDERKDGLPDSEGYVTGLEEWCLSISATVLIFCDMVKSLAKTTEQGLGNEPSATN
jgi:hypothetical protein